MVLETTRQIDFQITCLADHKRYLLEIKSLQNLMFPVVYRSDRY